jgi:integrase
MDAGGRPQRHPEDRIQRTNAAAPDPLEGLAPHREEQTQRPGTALEPLVREWLMDLKVLGRSVRTIAWYAQKMDWYLRNGGALSLEQLTAFEIKRYLAELQGRGLAPNTVHGCFQTLKAFANWAAREGYPVEQGVLNGRAPKVPQQEMETYSAAQIDAVLQAASEDWPRLAILTLLGTGMRVGELCALKLDDLEDEGDAVGPCIAHSPIDSRNSCSTGA